MLSRREVENKIWIKGGEYLQLKEENQHLTRLMQPIDDASLIFPAAFDIKDKGQEVWRFLLDDDFTGWKEIACSLKEFFPRKDWQPETAERNEVLDFPIMSFQFEPRLPGKGTYYFDCLKLVK